MLHLVSLGRNKGGKLINVSIIIFAALLLTCNLTFAEDNSVQKEKNVINNLKAQVKGNDLLLMIQCSSEPTYTVYELFKPSRIVVDIADAEVKTQKKLTLPPNFEIGLTIKSITNVNPNLTRIEFALPQSYSFNTSQKDNNIIITIASFKSSKSEGTSEGSSGNEASSKIKAKQSIESQLPKVDPMKPAKAKGKEKSASASEMEDTFSFAGYKKERITVDFYKIDLHNVFRLLREVSGANIVVDQAVAGSLTLALDDVPWDFALDIILNLKDLQKEERFNTIVILPKQKQFNWPERAEDNLSFEADEDMIVQESLVIQQQETIPQNVVEAKKIIAKGRTAEKKGNFETAVQNYEKGLDKWPDNGRLANKIAAIYLVQLRQNAKAVYYADKALDVDSKNSGAALNAAIASANMHENSKAQQYFDQSVNVGKPSSAALLSYASFSENMERYDAAIKLLKKHDEIYGQNVNSMISRARILDKMGDEAAATEVYRAILLSGYRIPPDLKKYITGRMSLSESK